MSRHHKGGRQWQQAKAELRSRGDAYCWRGCGTYLLVDAPQWHPQFMTMGHYIAVEDGGAQFDPNNYGPECKKCNYSDGARRTNKKLGNPHNPAGKNPPQNPQVDTNWYEPYQVGRPMIYEPTRATKTCPICSTPHRGQTYCSTQCQAEGNARKARDRYRRLVGLAYDPTQPTSPTRRLAFEQ